MKRFYSSAMLLFAVACASEQAAVKEEAKKEVSKEVQDVVKEEVKPILSPKEKLFMEVRDVIDYSCMKCHQSTNAAANGGFDMSTLASMLKGGDKFGAATLVKGSGGSSMMYVLTTLPQGNVKDKNESGAPRGMPLAPSFESLGQAQKKTLKDWIDGGCFIPEKFAEEPFRYRVNMRKYPTSKLYKDLFVGKKLSRFSAKPYTVTLHGKEDLKFDMMPIPAGKLKFGGKTEVKVDAFYMASKEVTWDLYDTYLNDLDTRAIKARKGKLKDADLLSKNISRPTPAYVDMTFGMGRENGYPAICMTQLSARMFCVWLSAKTGKFYRLATEAEWEYACKAGKQGKFPFPAGQLDDFAWHDGNCGEKYHKVGLKKPNAFGLYDMIGNVSEWTLDYYQKDFIPSAAQPLNPMPRNPAFPKNLVKSINPIPEALWPYKVYEGVARGGGWHQDSGACDAESRSSSQEWWKDMDPQIPRSVWWMTDSTFNGFRIVCDPTPPSAEDLWKYWPSDEEIKAIPERN